MFCAVTVYSITLTVPGLALWAGAFYMLCFAFITTQWHVYILNAVALASHFATETKGIRVGSSALGHV